MVGRADVFFFFAHSR